MELLKCNISALVAKPVINYKPGDSKWPFHHLFEGHDSPLSTIPNRRNLSKCESSLSRGEHHKNETTT